MSVNTSTGIAPQEKEPKAQEEFKASNFLKTEEACDRLRISLEYFNEHLRGAVSNIDGILVSRTDALAEGKGEPWALEMLKNARAMTQRDKKNFDDRHDIVKITGVVKVHRKCKTPGCDGHMQMEEPGDIIVRSKAVSYPHICNKCGVKEKLPKQYPYLKFIEGK